MRKLTVLTTAMLMLVGMAVSANAQSVASSAAGFHAQIKNATLFKQAACRGWGAHCAPGWVWRCSPLGCACVPCI